MKWKLSRTTGDNARRVLPGVVEKYFKAGRKASDGKRSPKELHTFRIATKRFRYTLEQFRPVYGAALDKRLVAVREIQTVLGTLHDYHAISEMLGKRSSLEAKLERLQKKKLKEFHEKWAALDSKRALKRWRVFLAAEPAKARPAHSKRKARIGSTVAARRAGMKLASSPTSVTPRITAA